MEILILVLVALAMLAIGVPIGIALCCGLLALSFSYGTIDVSFISQANVYRAGVTANFSGSLFHAGWRSDAAGWADRAPGQYRKDLYWAHRGWPGKCNRAG